MKTVCHKQLQLESLLSKDIVADFEGGKITSAAGCLLRELDKKYKTNHSVSRAVKDLRAIRKDSTQGIGSTRPEIPAQPKPEYLNQNSLHGSYQ